MALVSFVLAVATLASAQTVLLRYRPLVGKTVSYTVSISYSSDPPTGNARGSTRFSVTGPMTIHILSRVGGTTVIEALMGPGKFEDPSGSRTSAQAQNVKLAKAIVIRAMIDEYGISKVVDHGEPSSMASSAVAATGNARGLFPKNAVKVGDTWTSTLDLVSSWANGMKMNGKIPVVYRLMGLHDGAAIISMTAKGAAAMSKGSPPISVAMDVRSTILIDAATGLTRSRMTDSDTFTTFPGVGVFHHHTTESLK